MTEKPLTLPRCMCACIESLQSCPTLCDPMDSSLPWLLCPWDSPGKNIGVGSYSLLQGVFPTQGWNPGLPHCRQILYHLDSVKSVMFILVQSTGSRAHRLQQLQLPGSRAQAPWLWLTRLVVPQHVGSSRIRDATLVSCIGRQILYH